MYKKIGNNDTSGKIDVYRVISFYRIKEIGWDLDENFVSVLTLEYLRATLSFDLIKHFLFIIRIT